MNKILSFFAILIYITLFVACDFFSGDRTSITVSLDADSLKNFINENLSSQPVSKGHYTGEGADSLSLKVTLSGDETGVWTANITDKLNYRSNVSIKIDGLRVGAKIKVRADLVQDGEKIIISGGTKRFSVSAENNSVPIAMGNYTDIILWGKDGDSGSYYRGEIGDNFKSVTNQNLVDKTKRAMTFDVVNNSLSIVDGSDRFWYNTSWQQDDLANTANNGWSNNNFIFNQGISIAVKNNNLYYHGQTENAANYDSAIPIKRLKTGIVDTVLTVSWPSPKTHRAEALTLDPNRKRAYLAYSILFPVEYYIMTIDTSDDDNWQVISRIPIAETGDFLESDINRPPNGYQYSDLFRVTDMRVQEGYLWVLVKESSSGRDGVSRGALIRYDMSLSNRSRKVFGWTGDKQGPRAYFSEDGYYRTPPTKNSTNFFGPLKFIAVRPGELIIADDGRFVDPVNDSFSQKTTTNIDRIVVFDIEKEAVSNIVNFSELDNLKDYKFDDDYSTTGSFDPFLD